MGEGINVILRLFNKVIELIRNKLLFKALGLFYFIKHVWRGSLNI